METLPAAFTHALKTCEGYVSNNADEYSTTKTKLCSFANNTFREQVGYNYWGSKTANAVVIQLDGNYFVIDTDDEESDSFVLNIMMKYGVVDNVTPSLSNYLLGKKNKNHYWFRLPEDIRWTCKTNWVKGGRKDKENSHLDLLGSTNRIIFENKECLYRLKNIPILSQEMLNDICDYVPAALLGDNLNFEYVVAAPRVKPCERPRAVTSRKYDPPQHIKDYIDETFTTEDSIETDRFFFNGAHLLRRYGEGSEGRAAVHYFAAIAGSKVYDAAKVDTWLNATRVENLPSSYGVLKIKTNGKCIISLDDSTLSEASTAVNSVVSTDAEDEEVPKPKPAEEKEKRVYELIRPDEDKNFTMICKKIVPVIKKVLVYCRGEWYSYDDETHLWSVIKEPQMIIKEHLFECVAANNTDVSMRLSKVSSTNEALRKSLIETQALYLNMYKKIETLQVLALVKKDLERHLCDNEFCNKLDQTAGKLIYKDGVYDIETDTFCAGLKYEHFITYTLPYNYRKPTEKDKEYVKTKVKQICANEEWRYDYYMEILGYSMLGMPDKEQVAFFMVGETAGNGKSTLLEALTEMMPNLVVKLNSKTFSEGNNDAKKSISSIRGARVAWINEVEKKKQNVELIKDIADGKPILNPVLYQQKEEKIQIKAKPLFVSNTEVAFANDAGIKRRYRYVEFVAKFHTQQEYDALETKRDNLDFVRDNAFAEFLVTESGFFALLELILEGARRWFKAGKLVVPEPYVKLANAACDKNDEYAEFVSANIVKCEGAFVTRFAIEERYKEKFDRKMKSEKDVFRKYMASKGFAYDYNKSVKVKVYENGFAKSVVKDGVYMGCKLKGQAEVKEEEEE